MATLPAMQQYSKILLGIQKKQRIILVMIKSPYAYLVSVAMVARSMRTDGFAHHEGRFMAK